MLTRPTATTSTATGTVATTSGTRSDATITRTAASARRLAAVAMVIPYPLTVNSEPTKLAVLGGGQLGRMLGLAGIPLGLELRFLDPSADAPAAAVGTLVVGDLGDEDALVEVADGATVVTFEWEGVPAGAARFLADRGVTVRPGARSLEVAQDRLVEKETFRALGIRTPAFAPVDAADELAAAVDTVGGLPAVLKTRRGGYDGKGQRVLRDAVRPRRRVGRRRRGAVHPRAVPAPSTASSPCSRCAASTAPSRAGRWSRTSTPTASSA